nr:zf-HC2 domain-containing protein [Anaerolineae bacterium]
MKKHQPFETWILLDEPLTPEQAQSLDAHIKTCAACHALKAAWGRVDAIFQETPALEPVPGFANRWQAQLSQQRNLQRYARQRWQSWIT